LGIYIPVWWLQDVSKTLGQTSRVSSARQKKERKKASKEKVQINICLEMSGLESN
jgi:hypothetical protein